MGVSVMFLLGFLAPAAYASGPGVDEYTLDIPGPGHSDNHPAPGDVQSDPSALPPATSAQLQQSSDGALLSAIATSPDLGAPASGGHGPGGGSGASGASAGSGSGATPALDRALSRFAAGNDGRSVPASLASAAGDSSALPLLLVIAAITALGAAVVVRRRQIGSGGG